jgi:glutathione S-transferase
MFVCSCHIDPYFTTLVVERVIKARSGAAEDPALCADALRWLARFIPVLDEQLRGRAFVTERFGLADIASGCTLELSALLPYDREPFADVRAWLARLQARDRWRAYRAGVPGR